MSNDNKLTIISGIAAYAKLSAEPVMAYKLGQDTPAILVYIQDGINEPFSFCYLTPEQAIEAGEWLVKMGKSAKFTLKV